MTTRRSDDHHVEVPGGVTTEQMMGVVERAAVTAGLYISNVGGYSRKKFPNSVHWHFKRDPHERGVVDATFWDVKSLFWLMIRHSEPQWVKEIVPILLHELRREVAALQA